VSAVCDADKIPVVRAALQVELERIQVEPPSAAELSKAVKQFLTGTLATRKTMEGQAQDLGGNWLAAADLNFSERYLAAVQRLTPADLQRVARTYLIPEGRSTYVLQPETDVPTAAKMGTRATDHPAELFRLPNGLRLLVKEDHRLPFVEFRAALAGGLLAETLPTAGLTSLMAKLLVKGTARRSAEDIALAIESVGGSLEPYAGNQSFGVSVEVLSEDFDLGLDLLTDVLLYPQWPGAALERERQIQLASLKGQRDQLLQCAFKALRRQLFGDHGYGLDSLGTEESVGRFQTADLGALHRRLVTPDNCVLAIFGDVRADAVRQAVEKATRSWIAATEPFVLPAGPSQPLLLRSEDRRDKEQAVLALGFRGTTFDHADRYALELLQEACSDMGSRLFMRIRDELGLAYYVGATHFVGRTPGYFAFYCGTAPEKVDDVERELRAQAELLRLEGLTDEEITRAKAKIVGQRKIARQDLGQLASTFALDELCGLGFAHSEGDDARYESLTAQDLRAVAAKYLRPELAAVAIIRGA
jgi:zinc protease